MYLVEVSGWAVAENATATMVSVRQWGTTLLDAMRKAAASMTAAIDAKKLPASGPPSLLGCFNVRVGLCLHTECFSYVGSPQNQKEWSGGVQKYPILAGSVRTQEVAQEENGNQLQPASREVA